MKKLALILLTITMTSFARLVNVNMSVNAYDDCKSIGQNCTCNNTERSGTCGVGSDHGGTSLYCQCPKKK